MKKLKQIFFVVFFIVQSFNSLAKTDDLENPEKGVAALTEVGGKGLSVVGNGNDEPLLHRLSQRNCSTRCCSCLDNNKCWKPLDCFLNGRDNDRKSRIICIFQYSLSGLVVTGALCYLVPCVWAGYSCIF